MSNAPQPSSCDSGRPAPPGWVCTAVLIALLALTAGRMMLNEPPFHRNPMAEAGAYAGAPVSQQMYTPTAVLRVVSATMIGAMAALWATAAALTGKRTAVRHPLFGAGWLLLAICLLISAAGAADRREAFITAVEQISLLLAALMMMQLTAPAWRKRLVLIVLVGMAATLGLKGLYQAKVEIPEARADFQQRKAEILTAQGLGVETPEAVMLEARVVEVTTKGWFSLANVFGSLMILLTMAAAGLAADKWIAWRTEPPTQRRGPPAKSDEIPSPLVAAILSSLLVIPAAATWLLTGSIGAIASGVAAGVLAVGLIVFRRPAAKHRRTLLIVAVVGFTLLTAGVIGLGLNRGGLPMRTLQVRWEYWIGSARLLAERPLWGAGPGNFPDAYLPYRPAGAEEAVKNPHNVIVQVLSEYGLTGGTLMLALLALTLIRLTRPQREDSLTSPSPSSDRSWLMVAGVGALALLWRTRVTYYPNTAIFFIDNMVAILGVTAGLAAALWTGRTKPLGQRERVAGVALACGAAGFALHNLSDFALFKPAAAMGFWVACGAMLGRVQGRDRHLPRWAMAATAVLLTAGTIVTGIGVVRPVWRAERFVYEAAGHYSEGRTGAATLALSRAVKADPLDAAPAADMAGLLLRTAQARHPSNLRDTFAEASRYAQLACRRHRLRATYVQLHAQLLAFESDPDLFALAWSDPPGDLATQRQRHEKRLAADPGNPFLLNLSAQLAWHDGDDSTAANRLRRVMGLPDMDRPILADHLGDVYYRMGETKAARRQWARFASRRRSKAWTERIAPAIERVASLDPQNAQRRLLLAELAYQGGLWDLAREQLAAAETANAALWEHSVQRFNARRHAQAELLKAKLRDQS